MDENSGEVWVDVPGYYGLYQVSNYGLVRRAATFSVESMPNGLVVATAARPGYTLKQTQHLGYSVCGLTINGQTTQFKVHRLVADAFIPHSAEQTEVHHINHVREDNRASNLTWLTPEAHAALHKHRKRTGKYPSYHKR